MMSSIDLTGPAAVLNAQAQSAARARSIAETAAFNAPAFQQLNEKGIKTETFDFAQMYKDKILQGVDTDGNGTISQAELTRQVQAGGGTASQASALYKAMDMNHDGTLSAEEFENSIPVPLNEFINQRNAAFNMLQNGEKPSPDMMEMLLGVVPDQDPGQVLGSLASGFSKDA
jgi:Ca2+-binding EF-hand superfamily protein